MDIANINPNAQVFAALAQNPVPQEVAQERRVLIQAVKAVNASERFGSENELAFAFDRESKQPIVKIINRETREVVQQIPNEHVLRMAEELN